MAVLMGRAIAVQGTGVVGCPQIFPAILAALGGDLQLMTTFTEAGKSAATPGDPSSLPYTTAEALIEDFTKLHKSVPSFRRLFKSPQTTQMFLDAYRSFVDALTQACPNPAATMMLEKMTNFGLVLAGEGEVAAVHKSEVLPFLWSCLGEVCLWLRIHRSCSLRQRHRRYSTPHQKATLPSSLPLSCLMVDRY
jgi:hypothetical protein